MKKRYVGMLLLIGVSFALGACAEEEGGKTRGTYEAEEEEAKESPTPTEAAPVVAEETPTPTEAEPTPVETAQIPGDPNLSDEDMLEYLDGYWELCEGANLIVAPDHLPDVLTIDADSRSAMFRLAYADEEVRFDLDFVRNYYDGPYTLTLTTTEATEGFPQETAVAGTEGTYQFIVSNQVLMMREWGATIPVFSEEGLGYERAVDGWWVFRKVQDDEFESPASESRKNDHFFAVRYEDYGSGCVLQEVEADKAENIMLYGMETNGIAYRLAENADPMELKYYEYKGLEDMANSGEFAPALMEVETDENGHIIAYSTYDYYGLGYFEAEPDESPEFSYLPKGQVYEYTRAED